MGPSFAQLLHARQVRFVRITWCDNAGIIRAKAVHTQALPRHLLSGAGITLAQQALPVMADAVVSGAGLGPVGEVRLMPDWSTLVVLPYAPAHARVLGDMMLDGKPWPMCPRAFLRRMVNQASAAGLEIQAVFENEFYLVRPTPAGPVPVDDTVFAATWSMDQHHTLIDDIATALVEQGIGIEMYYPESGPGQQELSITHGPALPSADRQIVYRETVRAVALRHGLRATFLPRPFAQGAGSGAHLHLSLWHDGVNVTPDPAHDSGLGELARSFLAGILLHLPALMAITAPSTNSYRRIRPGAWSGAYRVWGVDNREAALRVPSGPADVGASHFELKTADATCNPHLALGAVIACGLDGCRRRLALPPAVQVDPAALSEEQRRERNIELLPATLGEALERLDRDTLLQEALGEPLFRAFRAVRQAEWQALGSLAPEEEVRLLWERY
jgi:glutamine synthetase